MYQLLSIIVPAYNEGGTIAAILESIGDVELPGGLKKEIIVVNDASRDNTIEQVERVQFTDGTVLRVINHPFNRGKGAAIKNGIKEASGELIIIQDADREYDPREFQLLLKPVLEGRADVVYGSRFVSGNPHRVLFFWHSIGNKLLTFLSNMTTNLNLTDMETCYKLFHSVHLKKVILKENRFGFEPEVTAKISRIPGIRIFEVGISYYGRTYAEGKKINWKDGLRAIYCIIKYGIFTGRKGSLRS